MTSTSEHFYAKELIKLIRNKQYKTNNLKAIEYPMLVVLSSEYLEEEVKNDNNSVETFDTTLFVNLLRKKEIILNISNHIAKLKLVATLSLKYDDIYPSKIKQFLKQIIEIHDIRNNNKNVAINCNSEKVNRKFIDENFFNNENNYNEKERLSGNKINRDDKIAVIYNHNNSFISKT
jgi:uncharacterized secreted protein with C-terminal beta-propeller domain